MDCSIAKFAETINEKKTSTTIFNTAQEPSSRQLAARLCMSFVLLFFHQHFTPLLDQIEDWPCFRMAYNLKKRFVFLKRSSLLKIVQCLFYLMRIIIILRSTIVMTLSSCLLVRNFFFSQRILPCVTAALKIFKSNEVCIQ